MKRLFFSTNRSLLRYSRRAALLLALGVGPAAFGQRFMPRVDYCNAGGGSVRRDGGRHERQQPARHRGGTHRRGVGAAGQREPRRVPRRGDGQRHCRQRKRAAEFGECARHFLSHHHIQQRQRRPHCGAGQHERRRPAGAAPAPVELLNALGQVVLCQPATGPSFWVEPRGLPAGMYTLWLYIGGAALAKRVVVE